MSGHHQEHSEGAGNALDRGCADIETGSRGYMDVKVVYRNKMLVEDSVQAGQVELLRMEVGAAQLGSICQMFL